MADELFEGCVASEMSLVQAMSQKILPVPKYVVSVYDVDSQLKKYETRITGIRNKKLKEKSEANLERLRRSLHAALNVQQIFSKYIEKKTGKYIVFCSTEDHMYEMISKVPEWFSTIDTRPHVYHVYSMNPEAEQEFEDFQNDDSDHLKLLFSIDMLNEGIHVDDVDGVVLLRPTESPIIYKQQIGRALAAGCKKTPIIFDMVNNFDSLYNIDVLKQEFDDLRRMYISEHKDNKAVDEFNIFDELRDSRDLFAQLQKNLDYSWDEYYGALCLYKREEGTVELPRRYITMEGLYLGRWLERQVNIRNEGRLDESRERLLENLGVQWRPQKERRFDHWIELLKEYKKEHGDVNPGIRYKTRDGENLGNWCSNMRMRYRTNKMPEERIKRLEEIGFQWQVFESQWEDGYKHAEEFFLKHGNLEVSKRYVSEDGFRLGLWIYTQRRVYQKKVRGILDESQIERLEKLNITWHNNRAKEFEVYVEAYRKYKKENLSGLVPYDYVTKDNVGLGRWVLRMRRAAREGQMSDKQIKMLDEVGFIWNNYDDAWMNNYKIAKEYYDEHHHLSIPSQYLKKHGHRLSGWLRNQKAKYDKPNHGGLSDEQVMLLEEIHIELRTRSDTLWMKGYAALQKYVKENGTTYIPNSYDTEDGIHLGKWVSRMKTNYWNRTISKTQMELLNKLKMDWRPNVEIRKDQNGTKINSTKNTL